MTNPRCIICRDAVLGSNGSAVEITCWESEVGLSEKTYTGRVAHLACLAGEDYDERQMSIGDMINVKQVSIGDMIEEG